MSTSKNVIGDADNQQETLKFSSFYYSGFLAGEMSCSIIRFKNHNPEGHYFMPDITVTNSDINLLKRINRILAGMDGIISAVKGAHNLSFRGKRKVRKVIEFLDRYPILAGDLAKNRIELIKKALEYLENNRGHSIHQEKTKIMEKYRCKLRRIKREGFVPKKFSRVVIMSKAIGYFLSGIIDSEGSIGMKKCGNYSCPFIAVAMKDEKIVNLFRDFIDYGNVRLRKDGVYHCEVNNRDMVRKLIKLFLYQYPLRHKKQRGRLVNIQRILNDYTPKSF